LTAAAILAGGRASRMGGRAKSFLTVGGVGGVGGARGARIIDRQLAVLRPLFAEILISANDPAPFAEFGVPVVADAAPGLGPLAGLQAVLAAARADRVVVVGCDMPDVSTAALEKLLDAPAADVVIPMVAGRLEPLFARYARGCLPAIRAALARGDFKATSFLDDVDVREVPERVWRALDPELGFLRNCNAPEDLL
jgi:molybdopterin-guanine dinucleotide biosynthesis protein A